MKNKRLLSLLVLCTVLSASLMGCEQLTITSDVNSAKTTLENTASNNDDSEKTNDTSSADSELSTDSASSDTHASIDELSESVGFTAYEIPSTGYVPVSYETIDNNVAQITYNHDGNTATLRMTDSKPDNLAGINGTENAEVYSLSDYDLDIDIQENDNKYIAEWTGLDMDGEEKYFSLVEENVDLAVFETTLSSFIKTALSSDQSAVSDDNSSDNDEVDEDENDDSDSTTTEAQGTVVATCDDSFETYVYKVEKSGTYKFTDPVSSVDTSWDIYVLDEEFEDAPRYISQAYTSQGSTPVTLELEEGQYAYCICNKNQWTVDEAVDCLLTITYFE